MRRELDKSPTFNKKQACQQAGQQACQQANMPASTRTGTCAGTGAGTRAGTRAGIKPWKGVARIRTSSPLPPLGTGKGISAETRDRTGDLQIFSLTLSQLSYRGLVLEARQPCQQRQRIHGASRGEQLPIFHLVSKRSPCIKLQLAFREAWLQSLHKEREPVLFVCPNKRKAYGFLFFLRIDRIRYSLAG